MASNCPVCGEKLAEGVLSRANAVPEATWFAEVDGPERLPNVADPVAEELPVDSRREGR